MSKFLAAVFLIAAFGVILNYQNCGQALNPNGAAQPGASLVPVSVTGTVTKLNLDGCNKVVVSDADGTSKFIPMGLKDTDLVEGAKVTITGHVPDDVVSTCMAGVIIKVDSLNGNPTH